MDVFLSVGWVSDRFPSCTLAKSFDRWRSHSPHRRTACFPKLISEPYLETVLEKKKVTSFWCGQQGDGTRFTHQKNWGHVLHYEVVLQHTDDKRKSLILFSLNQFIHRVNCDVSVEAKKWHPNCFLGGEKKTASDNLQLVQELLFIGRQTITQHKDPAGKRSWLSSQLEGEKKKNTNNENETMRKHGVQPMCRILVVTSEIFAT